MQLCNNSFHTKSLTMCISKIPYLLQRLQVELQNKQSTLDSITVKGKSLMDSCCHDESHDEVKKALEELNDKWTDLLRKLSEKSDQLAQGVKLSMKYETQESDFNSWLMSCKENHVLKCDLTSDFKQILQDLTVCYSLLQLYI